MESPQERRWLDLAFALSTAAVVGLVSVAMVREVRRPPLKEQRIVPALGLVDRCESCHDAAQHKGTLIDSHPVERFGCTTCHGGQGLSTTKNEAHLAHLDWERPLFTRLEREANCGTCHQGTAVPDAPLLSSGRRALVTRGCAGCHEIPGLAPPEIAPELDGLSQKVKPAWVRAWLTDPAQIDPAHEMPRFDLKPDQIEALIAFLWTLPGPDLGPHLGPHLGVGAGEPKGDSDRGKIAVGERRCATCHRFEGRGGTFASSLDLAGAKIAPAWMSAYLTDTHRLRPHTRMPGFRIPAAEAADIVAYATEQWVPDTETTPWAKFDGEVRAPLAEQGKKLFADLGCRGCHEVSGVPFVRVGMPLSAMGDKRVGDLVTTTVAGPVSDVPAYVARKVVFPKAFDAPNMTPSKMPSYRLEPTEAMAVGVAVGAMKARPRPAAYVRASKPLTLPVGATGKLIDRYRCLVCHRIGGEGGDISRIPLDGEGSRVTRAWLEQFLKSPTTIRMDQAERMPVLGIDAAEAARLAAWIESSLADARIPDEPAATAEEVAKGKALYEKSGCASCHLAEGKGTMKGPVLDGASERLQFPYVVAMLRLGNAVVPELRHPKETFAPADARAIAAWVCSLPVPKSLQVDPAKVADADAPKADAPKN